MPNAGYDPFTDFMPVILAPSTPNLITVNPAVPAKNLQQVMPARAREGCPTPRRAPAPPRTSRWSASRWPAKVDITHVPYQPAQAAGAAVGGAHADLEHLDAAGGDARARRAAARHRRHQRAALAGAARRADGERAGLLRLRRPHLDRGVRAAGTPQDIVNRLNSELNRALSAPESCERLASSASTGRATPRASSPPSCARRCRSGRRR